MIKPNKEILKQVEQREYQRSYEMRCVNVDICPICGRDLLITSWDDKEFIDKECKSCDKIWYV